MIGSAFWEQMGFWLAWLLIPIMVEIVPTIIAFVRLLWRHFHPAAPCLPPAKLPTITLVVPVYNSAATLAACIDSVAHSTYPNALIQVILANNHSQDQSFQVYQQLQARYPELRLLWLNTAAGKANALNTAIYNAIGSYIIHIDSDGVLETQALMNLVLKFEQEPDVDAMTGTILTQSEQIKRQRWRLRFLQVNEYYEYAQAFLAGRTIESAANQLFTMSGAFSAFRREVLLHTFLYSTDTVGEDTDMTFQIRQRLHKSVVICVNAFFYVEPISGLNELYTQRQRWQRGELEVVQQYLRDTIGLQHIFGDFMVRRLIIDHTFAFLRFIWLFATVVLWYYGYTWQLISWSLVLMYLLYVGSALLNALNVRLFLLPLPADRQFYQRHWWVVATLPVYNLLCTFFRVVGIINAMVLPAQWQNHDLRWERRRIAEVIRHDFRAKRLSKEGTPHVKKDL